MEVHSSSCHYNQHVLSFGVGYLTILIIFLRVGSGDCLSCGHMSYVTRTGKKKPSSTNVALVTANKSNFINIDLRKEEKDLLNFMKLQT